VHGAGRSGVERDDPTDSGALRGSDTGAFVEEKDFSLVWHCRGTDPELAQLRMRELHDAVGNFTRNLNVGVFEGSRIVEVKSLTANKGSAALRWLDAAPWGFVLAAGDDYTDEDLFGMLPPEAFSIKVGGGASRAKYEAENVSAMRSVLRTSSSHRRRLPGHDRQSRLRRHWELPQRSPGRPRRFHRFLLPAVFRLGVRFCGAAGRQRGGRFAIESVASFVSRQAYLRQTNILVTTVAANDGTFEVIDFMPRYRTDTGEYHCPPDIVRYIESSPAGPSCASSMTQAQLAENPARKQIRKEYLKHFSRGGRYESVYLYSTCR